MLAYESWYSSQLSPSSFEKVFKNITGGSDAFDSEKLSDYMGEKERQDKDVVDKIVELMSSNEYNTVSKEDFLRIFRYKL
jgi:hypothetical protein